MIYEKLAGYLRKPYEDDIYSSRLSTHEAIKAQLYVLGYKEGLKPVLEANCDGRIDCIYLRGSEPVCGLEVDYSIKKKSIRKLNRLPGDYCEKIIVSYGPIAVLWRAKSRNRGTFNNIRIFKL